MIKKFSEFDKPKKYGYVKAEIDIPNWNEILNIIDVDDLVLSSGDGGYAKNPHVTVLYGFNDVNQEAMKVFLENQSPPSVNIGGISLFENDDFDVVKFDVDSEDLKKMNEELQAFPHDKLYDKYTAHLTVAYVKKGTGKKYLDVKPNIIEKTISSRLVYTGSNRNVKIIADLK